MKYQYSCFSSHFYFLVFVVSSSGFMLLPLLLQAVVIRLSLYFKVNFRVFVSNHPRCLQCWRVLDSVLLLTYALYHLSGVRCCTLRSITLYFGLFVWVPLLSPENYTQGTVQVCMPLIRFLSEILVSSSLLVLLGYFLFFLPFLSLSWSYPGLPELLTCW